MIKINRPFETLLGVAVIVLLGTIVMFLFNNDLIDKTHESCYPVHAVFSNVEGVERGSKIMIAGTQVGEVVDVKLDPRKFLVTLELCIYYHIMLPEDSTFSITRDGLIGERYIDITPGFVELSVDSDVGRLKPGSTTHNTNDPLNIESLINKYL